jgi:hypothetical protein
LIFDKQGQTPLQPPSVKKWNVANLAHFVDSVRIYWNQLLRELLEYDQLRVCMIEYFTHRPLATNANDNDAALYLLTG